MDDKQQLLEMINRILSYFGIQAQYGGVESDIYNYYKKVYDKLVKSDLKGIVIYNWSRAYLEAYSDWNNPIIETMDNVNKLIMHIQKSS